MKFRAFSGRLSAWFSLVRLPNLVTVPGDPLAGYLLARMDGGFSDPGAALRVMLAALFFYAGGLMANDWADIDEDRRDRPSRPLPSGRISPRAAAWAAVVCMAVGWGIAATVSGLAALMAGLLVFTIFIYTVVAKSRPVMGPFWMGACRACSLWMGAAAAGRPPGWDSAGVAAVGVWLYVAFLTAVARHETGRTGPGLIRFLPSAVIGAGWLGLSLMAPPSLPALVLALAVMVWGVHGSVAMGGFPGPAATGAFVGRLVRGLLLIQAVFVAWTPGPGRFLALLLIAGWPLHAFLSRYFSPS